MTPKLQAIRGMEDVLPDESPLWERLEEACRRVFRRYGYRNIRTPIVEPTALFVRGIGEATDIVEKEMYVFEDRNGESLALRPEATAGIVRSAIEHNFLYNGPMRVWTSGPMFRYERPQKGRQRQFHQFDVEALGFEGPDVDAEQVAMLARLWKELGLEGVELHVNSIADAADRRAHREKLVAYFEKHAGILDEDAKRRLNSNPLRILDSKNPAMQEMIEGAPRLLDYLGEGAAAHFEQVKWLLGQSGIAYTVNPRLVRGLDYYNRTVFEFVAPGIGAQSTIAGGGRRGRARRGRLRGAFRRVGGAGGVAPRRGVARCRKERRAGCGRQLQVADEEGGRERCPLRGDHRRRRGGLAARHIETASRRRRAEDARPGRGSRGIGLR